MVLSYGCLNTAATHCEKAHLFSLKKFLGVRMQTLNLSMVKQTVIHYL